MSLSAHLSDRGTRCSVIASKVRMVPTRSIRATGGDQHMHDHQEQDSGIDRDLMQATVRSVRRSRLSRRIIALIAPVLLMALSILIPSTAIAAGQGSLQIGGVVVSQGGTYALAPMAPMAPPGPVQVGDETDPTANIACGSASDNDLIPLVRWTESIDQHHQLLDDGWLKAAENVAASARSVATEMPGALGQSMWGWSAQLVGFSIEFCPLRQAGPPIDRFAATIGRTVVDSGIGALLLIITLVLVVLRMVRASRMGPGSLIQGAKSLFMPVLMGALLVMVTNGAMSSTPASASDDGPYVPGFMSPGWIMTKSSDALAAIANAPLQGVMYLQDDLTPKSAGEAVASDQNGSCSESMAQWRLQPGGSPAISAVSTLWEKPGLRYYVDSQYGSGDNSIGLASFCRLQDYQAGLYTDTVLNAAPTPEFTLYSTSGAPLANVKDAGPGPRFAWGGADARETLENEDASLVGWMICRPGADGAWTAIPEATGDGGLPNVDNATCSSWWSDDAVPSALKIDPGKSKTILEVADPDLREALLQIHAPSEPSWSSGLALALSGFVALLVYGLIAIVIMVAKLGAVVLGLFLLGALIIGMWADSASRLKRFGNRTFGVLLFTAAAQAIFVVIAVLSMIIVGMGSAFFTSSSMMAIWAAAAPLLTILLLHFGAKSLMGASPFTIQGAKAMASSGFSPGMMAGIGALGGAVGSRMSRVGQGVRNLASKGDAYNSAGSKVTGGTGKSDGVQGMSVSSDASAKGAVAGAEGGEQALSGAGAAAAAAGLASRGGRRRMRGAQLEAERSASAAALQEGASSKSIAAGRVIGYNKKGAAVTRGQLDAMSAEDRRKVTRELSEVKRTDKLALAQQRRAAFSERTAAATKAARTGLSSATAGIGMAAHSARTGDLRALGRQAGAGAGAALGGARSAAHAARIAAPGVRDGLGAGVRGAAKAASWAMDHKKQAAMYAGAGALALTGVGLPAAAALGATAAGWHLSKAGVRASSADARLERDNRRAARLETRRLAAQGAIGSGAVQERVQAKLDSAASKHQRGLTADAKRASGEAERVRARAPRSAPGEGLLGGRTRTAQLLSDRINSQSSAVAAGGAGLAAGAGLASGAIAASGQGGAPVQREGSGRVEQIEQSAASQVGQQSSATPEIVRPDGRSFDALAAQHEAQAPQFDPMLEPPMPDPGEYAPDVEPRQVAERAPAHQSALPPAHSSPSQLELGGTPMRHDVPDMSGAVEVEPARMEPVRVAEVPAVPSAPAAEIPAPRFDEAVQVEAPQASARVDLGSERSAELPVAPAPAPAVSAPTPTDPAPIEASRTPAPAPAPAPVSAPAPVHLEPARTPLPAQPQRPASERAAVESQAPRQAPEPARTHEPPRAPLPAPAPAPAPAPVSAPAPVHLEPAPSPQTHRTPPARAAVDRPAPAPASSRAPERPAEPRVDRARGTARAADAGRAGARRADTVPGARALGGGAGGVRGSESPRPLEPGQSRGSERDSGGKGGGR
ncbi:hypothetical protein Bequi_13350 [Brachybacterium sp. JHP9]|uniref:Uncharacterized protein n=1 Tax=Brachybacterium equifaecis TaxID=2910770 RepID=A0ABT0R339_9MICO|nr:hypothetical protein [Brachybacterium equifaecis]MCL6424351.1 hypothetical protein [Brachybacterium equifaecis]